MIIPVNTLRLDGNEKRYLEECIESGWISSEGPFVERLEQGVAARLGRRRGIAVCNGTAALEVAVAALQLDKGSEVILPSLSIISCAAAVVRNGLVPVAVDCDADTWNMQPELVARAISARTSAIMIVHTYGLPVDVDPILDLAREHGLRVIEDAAEAIGQTHRGRPCGSFGDLSVLSFYPNKHITTGEGGMVLADDEALAARCASLRNLCFKQPRFVHDELGYNFRMSNIQAALGVAQLERLDDTLRRKRHVGAEYQRLLRGVPGLQLPVPATAYAENLYWVFGVVLADDVAMDATEAASRLARAGIGTRPFFWPLHEQPVLRNMGFCAGLRCPVSERLARRGFYLPSGVALSDADVARAAEALEAILR